MDFDGLLEEGWTHRCKERPSFDIEFHWGRKKKLSAL
jgi:hypothetical protein